jgi:hypothetical protein
MCTNKFYDICGVTGRENLNEDIERQLGIVNVVEEIEEKLKRWQEHVIRVSSFRYPRQAVFYKRDGK